MRDIIFDFDGTIIDSRECIFGLYRRLFGELGLPVPEEEVMRKFIGPPVEFVITRYLPEERRAAACARFREMYGEVDLKKANKLFDGTTEMLDSLVGSGKRLFIATTKNERSAKIIAETLGIKKYFCGIYGSRYELNRLTKRLVIEAAMTENGIDAKDTVLIGDTHFDAEGAQEAGIPVAIVKYGFGEEEELAKYNVAAYFDTPQSVAEYYKNK